MCVYLLLTKFTNVIALFSHVKLIFQFPPKTAKKKKENDFEDSNYLNIIPRSIIDRSKESEMGLHGWHEVEEVTVEGYFRFSTEAVSNGTKLTQANFPFIERPGV